MARGPKPASIVLTTKERETLQRLARRRGAGQAAVMRARIVLAADAKPQTTNKAIAAHLGVSRQNVITWRQRFLAHRLDGLVDAPRSGAPRRVGDEAVERMITLALEEQPAGATHWSTRDMARRVGMSQTMVSRVWRAFGLQPGLSEFSCVGWHDGRGDPPWPDARRPTLPTSFWISCWLARIPEPRLTRTAFSTG